jgi:hypothetical protein
MWKERVQAEKKHEVLCETNSRFRRTEASAAFQVLSAVLEPSASCAENSR